MRILFLLAAIAIVGPLPIALANVARTYDSDVAAAIQKARADFASLSPGRAKVLAHYQTLERDRKNDRPVLTWSPSDCEKEALALMYRMEDVAVARVHRPGILGEDTRPLPASTQDTVATLTLSVDCIRELDPQRMPPPPPLPPLVPDLRIPPADPSLPPPPKPLKVPKEFEGWMSAGKPGAVESIPPEPWPSQDDLDQQRKFSERTRP